MAKKPNPLFTMSADARLYMRVLREAKVGDVVKDADLAHGDEVNRGAVRTALLRLLRDEDMVFDRIRKVGWKRLDSSEIVSAGAADVERLRRKARRSIERQMKADFEQLDAREKMQFTANVSVMATVAHMTKPKMVEKIAASAPSGVRELPIAATLGLFLGKS